MPVANQSRRCPNPCARILFAAACWMLVGSIAGACNIPVFRYALERWQPDRCEVIIFHDGATADDQEAIDELISHTSKNGGHANADVTVVNINKSTPSQPHQEMLDLWDQLTIQSEVTLPHVLVRSKIGRGQFVNHWNAPLSKATTNQLFSSPVRQQIKKRLLEGDSIVWLLIQSDSEEKNSAAKQLLQDSFSTLSSKIQLPDGIGLPGSELYAEVPLVVKFSLLEIAHDDPQEQFLIKLFSGIRHQAYSDGEPLIVPVFGRGRALEVVPARDITLRLVEELTVFLSGACSCQVKEQNPGFDLLIESDWENKLFGSAENRPPDRSDQEGQNRRPTLVPIPAGRK